MGMTRGNVCFYLEKCISFVVYLDMGMTRGNVCFYLEKCISLIVYLDMGMTHENFFLFREMYFFDYVSRYRYETCEFFCAYSSDCNNFF